MTTTTAPEETRVAGNGAPRENGRPAADKAITIDGTEVAFTEGETIYEAATRCGHDIPTLCYDPRLEPFGACRLCVVEVEGAGGVEQQPDEAVPLLGGEAHQRFFADRDTGEVLGRRLRPEHAAAVIRPVVIGTDEGLADAAGAIQQAGAAVAAGVEQAAHAPVVVADQQHRHAGDVEREVVAGLFDLAAEGERQRLAPEERCDLVGERRLAGVAAAVDRHRGLGLRQGAAADAVERLGGEASFGLELQ